MVNFSSDPAIAEKQMRAIIFYLTTFGYIDGDFDASEKAFVRDYIGKLVTHRVDTAASQVSNDVQAELIGKYTSHFHEIFEGIDEQVRELFTEAVAKDEDQEQFVHAKLKLRCFEIFQTFDGSSQAQLMQTIDALIMADGEAHPAEVKFREELAELLDADLAIEVTGGEQQRGSVEVTAPVVLESGDAGHAFFDQFEHHYSGESSKIRKQVRADVDLIDRSLAKLEEQRKAGAGKLSGKQKVTEFAGQDRFMDGHVVVHPAKPGVEYELTVLGDLHGCYSCLKAAIIQSQFLTKVQAYRKDPDNHPLPLLVLLGDYIDRGIFSLNGVLRTVLLLYCTAPEHVVVLRGNHEYFVEYNGKVYGGVKPSEAIDTLKPHVEQETFKHYIKLFESLPSMLLFDRNLFVHAGIPRDRLLKERYEDLSSLNDSEVRFQMMWSDPSSADVIPADLQEQSARFPFGRLQALHFLQRIGCHTLIRGHEKVNQGFVRVYDEPNILLATLFSSGGRHNDDLPSNSSYRNVTPMALTFTHRDNASQITPWEIDYAVFNDPERNAFFKSPPELRHGG